MTNYEIWQAVLADFELKLSKANFTTWFSSTGIDDIENSKVTVCVPSKFIKSWLEKKYHHDITKSLERVTGKPIKGVTYAVKSIKNVKEQDIIFDNKQAGQQSKPATKIYGVKTTSQQMGSKNPFGISQHYRFDNYIVGKGNELAHAAAQAVANRPGQAYNPLYIYGGVGLGKTHLLHAIANSMLINNPGTRILYVSSEKFTNEFVSAVKEGRAKEFKDRYRNVDLLLIDDIQFIGGKEQTQEEFFHTFNELHQQSKQVVLTSDRPPKQIPSLEDRLRSRFEWGMIVDISPPDLETRSAILQAKAQEKSFYLPDEIAHQIAVVVQSNIRELEGVLNKVVAFHELKRIEPSKETVQGILDSIKSQSSKRSATPKDVIAEVVKYYDITLEEIVGKSREKRLSFPRQISMYLLREELKLSYPAIGGELGGRDHTTAMHAHTKIRKKQEEDAKIKQDLDAIKQRLYTNSI